MEKFNITNCVENGEETLTAAAARVREFEGRKHTPMSLEEIAADTDCVNVYAVYVLGGGERQVLPPQHKRGQRSGRTPGNSQV